MSNKIHQLTSMPCQSCGASAMPKISSYHDKYTQETITEATWICPRCNSKIFNGEINRTKTTNER